MKKTVLLVDDEEIIRLTSGEIMEELGYNVIVAGSGNEALEIFKNRCHEIAFVFLDMTLPDYSGMDLLLEMKKISSGIKFLLTSGYRVDMTGINNEAIFIQKPYTISELSTKLHELIC